MNRSTWETVSLEDLVLSLGKTKFILWNQNVLSPDCYINMSSLETSASFLGLHAEGSSQAT